ncbi:MAG: hypothetical protein E7110_01955 [Bacteroidales bacterium]|nr:hypothetical protein [Bacteroidales bacterium]
MKRIKDMNVVPMGIRSGRPAVTTSRSFPRSDGAFELLEHAAQCHESLYKLRRNVRRARRYYRGDQWSDIVVVNGKSMTEAEYIQSQGKPALKQNLIRPPLRNILGQFRKAPYKSVVVSVNRDDQAASEMMSVALESTNEMNHGKERDVRKLEEFLVEGTAIYHTSYTYNRKRKKSIPTFKGIELERFFQTPSANDICGEDVDFIGHIVDCRIEEVIESYAKTKSEEKELEDIFATAARRDYWGEQVKGKSADSIVSFLTPANPTLCRIFHIWRLEGSWKLYVHDSLDGSYEIYDMSELKTIKAENAERMAMAASQGVEVPLISVEKKYVREWMCYHVTANGHCLFKSSNPYAHNSHPYIVKFYPMLNNEVWSLVDDMIDQQRMINRMVILQDFIISASAKGVLLVPEDCITDDFTLEDIAEEWTKYNSVIKIKLKPGMKPPEQIAAKAMPVGINDMINLQMKLLSDIGGVHDAMQGKTAASNTPAGLYQQEAMNAQMNIIDYLESYASFLQERDYKILQLIKQYYTEKQYIALTGKAYSKEAHQWDPEKIRNIEFENRISRSTDTATMRLYMDDTLKFLLERNLIGVEMFLEHSSLPFADKLLQTIQRQREQLSQGQIPDDASMQALQQGIQQNIPASTPEGLQNARNLYNLARGGYNAA